MIKLCFKEYPVKMSLGAMKQFKQATGQDLWFSLLQFLETFHTEKHNSPLALCRALYKIMDFETASHAFHALINGDGGKVPLIEIEDAMFRVGWLPTDDQGDYREPWPLVMVQMATECDEQLRTQEVKKAVSAYLTPVKRKLKPFDFDYWGWWTHAVKHLNIAPSEAWRLDYSELCALTEKKEQSSQDTSLMLQFERKRNGAPQEIIGGLFNGH